MRVARTVSSPTPKLHDTTQKAPNNVAPQPGWRVCLRKRAAHGYRQLVMSITPPSDKRRHPRQPIFFAAMLTCAGQGWLSEVRDLSRGGARLARPVNWVDGLTDREYRLYFIFDQETVVGLDARCVREGSDDLGFEFLSNQESAVSTLLYESRLLDLQTS